MSPGLAEKKGAARVAAAARTLSEQEFIRKEQRPGQASRLFLLEETGSGRPYTHPGSAWDAASTIPREQRPLYFRIPNALWTNGWMAALSGPALFMYLAVLNEARSKQRYNIWFSPAVANERYGLTEVTRRKGLAELEAHSLIDKDRMPVGQLSLGAVRMRNTFDIDPARLEELKPGMSFTKPGKDLQELLAKMG